MGPVTFKAILEISQNEWSNHVIFHGTPFPFKNTSTKKPYNIKTPWHELCFGEGHSLTTLKAGYSTRKNFPTGIVIHNALCYNIESAWEVFNGKKTPKGTIEKAYAPAFAIDNKAKAVHQYIDPSRFKTFHVSAQGGQFNNTCIGIDNVNLLDTDYFDHPRNAHKEMGSFRLFKENRFIQRRFLKLHPEQIQACKDLVFLLQDIMSTHPKYVKAHAYDSMGNREIIYGDLETDPDEFVVVAHGQIQENRWDGFDFLTEILPNLKDDEIYKRNRVIV